MNNPMFFNRHISWLSFNERGPLVGRIKCLSIYNDLRMTRGGILGPYKKQVAKPWSLLANCFKISIILICW